MKEYVLNIDGNGLEESVHILNSLNLKERVVFGGNTTTKHTSLVIAPPAKDFLFYTQDQEMIRITRSRKENELLYLIEFRPIPFRTPLSFGSKLNLEGKFSGWFRGTYTPKEGPSKPSLILPLRNLRKDTYLYIFQ